MGCHVTLVIMIPIPPKPEPVIDSLRHICHVIVAATRHLTQPCRKAAHQLHVPRVRLLSRKLTLEATWILVIR